VQRAWLVATTIRWHNRTDRTGAVRDQRGRGPRSHLHNRRRRVLPCRRRRQRHADVLAVRCQSPGQASGHRRWHGGI